MTKKSGITDEEKHSQAEAEASRARARLEQLIEEQGIKPLTADELRAMGDLWPAEENLEDFLKFVRESRREGSERPLP